MSGANLRLEADQEEAFAAASGGSRHGQRQQQKKEAVLHAVAFTLEHEPLR
ncbi:hypothetical protein [Rhodopirellula bahusiensis]|uniref:hypothetical protein n=1 Tax=Rhodopirellula bahusiensis TaxID=2014065 RepID=UPI003263DF2E